MSLPKVLIIEDRQTIQNWLVQKLSSNFEVIQALTFEEAEVKFFIHRESLFAVAVDGCLSGNILDTPPLVKKMRENNFTGPIIAMSSLDLNNDKLQSVGCDHRVKGKREDLVQKLDELLRKKVKPQP